MEVGSTHPQMENSHTGKSRKNRQVRKTPEAPEHEDMIIDELTINKLKTAKNKKVIT